jgi:hypothetical protein
MDKVELSYRGDFVWLTLKQDLKQEMLSRKSTP